MKKFQVKLFTTLALTSALPLFIVGFISVVFLHRMAFNAANQRLSNTLKLAKSAYQSTGDNLKFVVRDQNRRLYTLLADDQIDLLKNEYAKITRQHRLDFFVVTDPSGTVLVSMGGVDFEGRDYSRDPLVRRAIRGQTVISGEVMEAQELRHLGLAEKAALPGVTEPRGLTLKACMPIINNNEIIVGTVVAGYLLNNNNAVLVDPVTAGTDLASSVFLGDMRISSNAQPSSRARGLGSRLSARAAQTVLEGKKDYFGRMAVSGKWYLAGYFPLFNSKGDAAGILGIGLPEKSIFSLRDELTKLFVIAVIASIGLSLLIGLVAGGAIASSVNKLYWGIESFGRGDYTHRIEIRSGDEIEELAEFFNKTMQQLAQAQQQLDVCARNVQSLESQVTQSAHELAAAQKQLVEYERMAAMGRMATALGHELRNVFAEIQTSLYNLRGKAARDCPQFVPNLTGIEASLANANETISNVLKFSYPKKPILSDVDINYLATSLLSLPGLQEQFQRSRIAVDRHLQEKLEHVRADGLQLREAVHNLLTNAVQAMPEGGKLGIFTWSEKGMVMIKIADTGSGMSKQALDNLFTPFFTTKSRGLGLGLCITRAIVQEHGGSVQVFSEQGKGTTFIITLPAARTDLSAGG